MDLRNPWWRFFVSLLSALLVLVPLLIAEIDDRATRVISIAAFVFGVFLFDWMALFRPDSRFESARDPALDFLFQYKFYSASRKLKANERLPFRVNIMRPYRKWLFWQRMKIVYSYGMRRTDSDYRISLPKGHGLCWNVLTKGQPGWFERAVHGDSHFDLTPAEQEATSHVCAILSIPLRRKDSERPHAVLNFDALNDAAVEDLRIGKDELKSHQGKELVDIATLAGLLA